MSKVFDQLEDETPLTIGEEIGQALAEPLGNLNATNEQFAIAVAQAIKDALAAVGNKQVVVQKSSVKKWIFKVIKHADGTTDEIHATAIF